MRRRKHPASPPLHKPRQPSAPPRLVSEPHNPPLRATLRLLGARERVLVLGRPVLHIGRAHDRCGLVLDDPDIAPQHCCLRLHHDRWWLLDRGAPAGTYVNSERCRQPRELHDGDRISIGLCLLEFRCTSEAQHAALACLTPIPLELPPPPSHPPPQPSAPPLRTLWCAALVGLAITLPVAAALTPTFALPVPADIAPLPALSDTSTRPAPPQPPSSAATEFLAEPPALELPADALARGRPDAGHLEHALRLPPSPDYLIRCPAHAHASSSTTHELMQALSAFRNHSAYRGEIVVGDLSQAAGGRYGPHRSHQSGRDVDLWLPIVGGRYRRGCVRCGTDLCRPDASEVDWRATWQLVHALATRGSAQDIFLARELQPSLRRAARELGVPEPELEQTIQHPTRGRPTLIKHAAGHTHHLHVRFRCPPDNHACIASP